MCSEKRCTDRAMRPGFSVRANTAELIDGTCSYDDLRDCLRDLGKVNRLLRAYAPTLRWLRDVTRHWRSDAPIHILDVGCGGGDTLRRIERWAKRAGISVRLTGIDINKDAVRAAREFTPAVSRIRWVAGDAYSFDMTRTPADIVISSLVTHHLRDEEIVRLMAWMDHAARLGWFINDLYRSKAASMSFAALAGAARWHRFIRHDGPISVSRSFRPEEWNRFASAAGLPPGSVCVKSYWPVRICVARNKSL